MGGLELRRLAELSDFLNGQSGDLGEALDGWVTADITPRFDLAAVADWTLEEVERCLDQRGRLHRVHGK